MLSEYLIGCKNEAGQFRKVGRTFRTLSRLGFLLSMGASRFQSVHDVYGY